MLFLNVVFWALWLFQIQDEPRSDLTLNYIIIGVLVVVALFLSVVVGKDRIRERDEEWDS